MTVPPISHNSHAWPLTRPRILLFLGGDEVADRRVECFLVEVIQRRENRDSFDIYLINIERRADLAARFRITETPTVLVIAGDEVKTRLTRPKRRREIREQLQPWL